MPTRRSGLVSIIACVVAVAAFLVVQGSIAGASSSSRRAVRDHLVTTQELVRLRRVTPPAQGSRTFEESSASARWHDTRIVLGSSKVPVSRLLLNQFAVLRRHLARISDAPPALPMSISASLVQNSYVTVNVSQARYVSLGAGGVWIIPGSNGACILNAQSYVTVCGLTSQVLDGDLRTGNANGAGDLTYVFGLVPDGGTSVTVASADGSDQTVPVISNMYEASGSDLTTVTVQTASGAKVAKPLSP